MAKCSNPHCKCVNCTCGDHCTCPEDKCNCPPECNEPPKKKNIILGLRDSFSVPFLCIMKI